MEMENGMDRWMDRSMDRMSSIGFVNLLVVMTVTVSSLYNL